VDARVSLDTRRGRGGDRHSSRHHDGGPNSLIDALVALAIVWRVRSEAMLSKSCKVDLEILCDSLAVFNKCRKSHARANPSRSSSRTFRSGGTISETHDTEPTATRPGSAPIISRVRSSGLLQYTIWELRLESPARRWGEVGMAKARGRWPKVLQPRDG